MVKWEWSVWKATGIPLSGLWKTLQEDLPQWAQGNRSHLWQRVWTAPWICREYDVREKAHSFTKWYQSLYSEISSWNNNVYHSQMSPLMQQTATRLITIFVLLQNGFHKWKDDSLTFTIVCATVCAMLWTFSYDENKCQSNTSFPRDHACNCLAQTEHDNWWRFRYSLIWDESNKFDWIDSK